jgi:hypothetical protein
MHMKVLLALKSKTRVASKFRHFMTFYEDDKLAFLLNLSYYLFLATDIRELLTY